MSLEFKKISGSTPYFLNNASTAEELTLALEDYMRTGTQIIFTYGEEECVLSSFEYKSGIESTVIAYFVTPKKKLLKVDTAAGFDLVITESGDFAEKKDITWENLPDKPFGEITENLGDTVTWDGNLETFKGVKTESVTASGITMQYVKVSDSVPSASDIGSNSTVSYMLHGSNKENETVTNIIDNGNGILSVGSTSSLVLIVPTDNITIPESEIVFPEKGVYFLHYSVDGGEPAYNTKFTIPNYNFTYTTLKKIEEKYLPDYKAMIDEAIGNAIGGSY